MRPDLRLGTVAGIDVGIRWAALAVLSLVGGALAFAHFPYVHPDRPAGAYLLAGFATVALFAASVLALEMAHVLAGRAHGAGVRRTSLWWLGGRPAAPGGEPTPRARLLVAAAGPATGVGLAAGFAALTAALHAGGAGGLPATVTGYLAAANLALAVLSLIPGGFPIRPATAEPAGTAGRDRLAGISVGDVMTPDPVTAVPSAWLAAFIENTALSRPFSTYPLVDLDGRLAGLATLQDIRAVPADRRWWTRLGDIATPPERVTTADPDEPLADLVARIGPDVRCRAVVVNDRGQVIGVVSPSDLARAAILADLRTATPGGQPPARRDRPAANGDDRLLPT